MATTTVTQLRRVRDTAQRKLSGEWDFEAIFNREIYPALNSFRTAIITQSEFSVFNLTGAANTLAEEHIFNYVRISHGSACTFTIPTDANGGFSEGHWVRGIQAGAGTLTIVAAPGVTIHKPETLILYKQYAPFVLIHDETADTWDFNGDVELA